MIVYDVETKILDKEIIPQHTIAEFNYKFIVSFSQEKPLRWKEINTHIPAVIYLLIFTVTKTSKKHKTTGTEFTDEKN